MKHHLPLTPTCDEKTRPGCALSSLNPTVDWCWERLFLWSAAIHRRFRPFRVLATLFPDQRRPATHVPCPKEFFPTWARGKCLRAIT